MQLQNANTYEVQAVQPTEIIEAIKGDDMRLMRAEVDIQIATAKRYPRSVHSVLAMAESLATVNPETAASCFYKLPRKQDGRTGFVEGPSVRLAEIMASAWGNMRVGGRVIGETDRFVIAQGVACDMERNLYVTQDVRRRITGKHGRYNDDMIAVTANAAVSIAVRNAIIRVIPRVYFDQILAKAKKVAVGDAKTLVQRRKELLDYLTGKMALTMERILHAVEREHVEDITLTDMETLHGLATAVRDGDISIDEAFPEPADEAQEPRNAEDAGKNGKGNGKPPAARQSKARRLAEDIEAANRAAAGASSTPQDAPPSSPDSDQSPEVSQPEAKTLEKRIEDAVTQARASVDARLGQETSPKSGSVWDDFSREAEAIARELNVDPDQFFAGLKRFKAGKGWVNREHLADRATCDAALQAMREGRFDWSMGYVRRAQAQG